MQFGALLHFRALGYWQNNMLDRTTKTPCIKIMEDWHKGRKNYSVWLTKVNSKELLELADIITDELFRAVKIIKVNQPHITIFVSGFVVDKKRYDDDITLDSISKSISKLSKLKLDTSKLRVTGINYNEHVIYFTLDILGDSISKLREVLSSVSREVIFNRYFPHITIGHYTSNVPLSMVGSVLDKYKVLPLPIEVQVEEVECVWFDALTPAMEGIGICKSEFIAIAKRSIG